MSNNSPAVLPNSESVSSTTPSRPRVSRAAVVVNAAKLSGAALAEFQAVVDRAFLDSGVRSPLWLPTTERSRGAEQTREAIRSGADLVLVAGGDGTVRTVGQELAGTGATLALLPIGTGNLLARNLDIPRRDLRAAVHVAVHGHDRKMDVGRLELDRDGDGRGIEHHAFLVMAGAGFDAATMAGASTMLKRRLGSAAYLVSGALASQRRMVEVTTVVDGGPRQSERSRGIVVGNHGSLTMGLTLLPEASCDDGRLDAVLLLQHSVSDWVRSLWRLITCDVRGNEDMPQLQGREINLRSEIHLPVEVDGDVVGEAKWVHFSVEPGALLVRCP
ncbi:NAD(+)/NADH kinase [Microbacteriaceae bacterium VKM Ac-2855]|nr:NAD(+)/NADH kinase [Microbacteriaceae bacterium VKM Ac-2855]